MNNEYLSRPNTGLMVIIFNYLEAKIAFPAKPTRILVAVEFPLIVEFFGF
jgi:hypothetical protein